MRKTYNHLHRHKQCISKSGVILNHLHDLKHRRNLLFCSTQIMDLRKPFLKIGPPTCSKKILQRIGNPPKSDRIIWLTVLIIYYDYVCRESHAVLSHQLCAISIVPRIPKSCYVFRILPWLYQNNDISQDPCPKMASSKETAKNHTDGLRHIIPGRWMSSRNLKKAIISSYGLYNLLWPQNCKPFGVLGRPIQRFYRIQDDGSAKCKWIIDDGLYWPKELLGMRCKSINWNGPIVRYKINN